MSDSRPPADASKAVPVVVRLPHASVEDFIQRFAACLTAGGAYVHVEKPHPVGTLVQLEVQLRTGERVIFGLGLVSFTTGGRGGAGHPGIGVKFLELDAASAALVRRACAGRPGADASLPPLPTGVGAAQGEAAPQPATIFVHATERAAPPPVLAAVAGAAAPIESPLAAVRRVRGRPAGPIIGIDLGTTYSCVACVKGGKPFVIPSREGHATMPSVVALNSRRKLLVGHPAQAQRLTNPAGTVHGAKRLVGRPFNSEVVQRVRERFQYEIVEGREGEAAVRLGGQVFSLHEISALILLELRAVAEQHLGTEVRRAVITVPAYYNDHQRQAVREAGALAGLFVERILNEPTAAGLAFGYGRDLHRRVLVYDLGGGTFDASLLQLDGDVYQVVSTGGDTFLGGVDFDLRIVDRLLADFEILTGTEFNGDPIALQRLVDAAERAKRALSEQAETRVHVPFLTVVDGAPYDVDYILSRREFESLTAPQIERTLEVCREVLAAGKVAPGDVDEVLLVGGMSRVPLVHAKVAELFGRTPHRGVHPDEAVAIGAALFAHSLGQIQGVTLVDVLPMSIGVALPGGRLKHILERNTPLPHSKEYEVVTTRDDQTELELDVFQGDSERIDGAEHLGSLRLAPLPRGPRGSVRIAVRFALSAECLLTLTARELSSGAQVSATLSTRDTPEVVRARLRAPTPVAAPATSAERGAGGSWLGRLFARLAATRKAS